MKIEDAKLTRNQINHLTKMGLYSLVTDVIITYKPNRPKRRIFAFVLECARCHKEEGSLTWDLVRNKKTRLCQTCIGHYNGNQYGEEMPRGYLIEDYAGVKHKFVKESVDKEFKSLFHVDVDEIKTSTEKRYGIWMRVAHLICPVCGTEFKRPLTTMNQHIRSGRRTFYCSPPCAYKMRKGSFKITPKLPTFIMNTTKKVFVINKHDLNPHKPNAVYVSKAEFDWTQLRWEMTFVYGDVTGRNLMARKHDYIKRFKKERKIPWKKFKIMYKRLKKWAIDNDCRRND